MKRHLPTELLDTLDFWLNHSWSCVKWFDAFSDFFKINLGVRQASVISPFLFAINIDDITNLRSNGVDNVIILYADDSYSSHCHRLNCRDCSVCVNVNLSYGIRNVN
jgi:hypothetical protein